MGAAGHAFLGRMGNKPTTQLLLKQTTAQQEPDRLVGSRSSAPGQGRAGHRISIGRHTRVNRPKEDFGRAASSSVIPSHLCAVGAGF